MIEDVLRSLRKSYFGAPAPLKWIIGRGYRCLPSTIRLGPAFSDFVQMIENSQGWSASRMQDLQFELLRSTLNVAYSHIPYYRNSFDRHGVTPSDFKALSDIERFPYLTKNDVKENFAQLINPRIPKWKQLITTTGGSTAEPMRFLQVKGLTRSKERAFIFNGWARTGYRPGVPTVQFKGRTVGNPDAGIHWEYEPIQNYLEMDSNFLTLDRVPKYLKAIQAFSPSFCIAYPSSIYQFARHLRTSGLPAPRFKAILLASENVYPWQRTTLEEVFGCRIFSHYGHSEMVLLGMEAAGNHDLLFFPQYGFLEIVGESGPVDSCGAVGELVGTSFHNYIMPFIRYRTQDLGRIGERHPDYPGYPVLREVEGRLQEFIVTRDRRYISVCVMGAAHFDTLDSVAETQYYQETPGRLEFRVVPRAGYSQTDRERILRAVKDKVGTEMDVTVTEVPHIERTRSGKHMMLVQKIPIDILERGQSLILNE